MFYDHTQQQVARLWDHGIAKTQFAAERLDMENQTELVYRELLAKAFGFMTALQIPVCITFEPSAQASQYKWLQLVVPKLCIFIW